MQCFNQSWKYCHTPSPLSPLMCRYLPQWVAGHRVHLFKSIHYSTGHMYLDVSVLVLSIISSSASFLFWNRRICRAHLGGVGMVWRDEKIDTEPQPHPEALASHWMKNYSQNQFRVSVKPNNCLHLSELSRVAAASRRRCTACKHAISLRLTC